MQSLYPFVGETHVPRPELPPKLMQRVPSRGSVLLLIFYSLVHRCAWLILRLYQ
ncbi:hypothetical protein BDV41DRAFT_137191 [Aspergillus transmontanensis]|uniref:Uncharacterized protein n=1 Tax=Aspergillus transmontanensis TaxID=1034304 RepID=A0A5N6W706_9EURO|nr:hypothetical protein BDV41DRAFT_137191 [Aspergillus transmontanensis]